MNETTRSLWAGVMAAVCVACASSSPYPAAADGGTGTTSSGASGGALACVQKTADGADSDCVELGMPRKLDCQDGDEAASAIAAGCVREDPKDGDDFDVCCPKTVRGAEPAVTSVSCREKDGADGDPECADFAGKPKKLDCDTETNVKQATSAGCVRQKSTSTDVCCPSSVEGSGT